MRCVKGEDCHRLSTRKNLEGDYLFCSVPAVTHYARDTVQFLEEAGVDTLKRDDNPPNVPQLRPIEDFLGRYEAGGISRRLGGSSEAKLKI